MRATVLGAGLVGFPAGGLVWATASSGDSGVRDVPPEVAANAAIARQRMSLILGAIAVYQNDNGDLPPARLSDLYPTLIADPLVFWHPGDSDPPPTTIDNDVPNAPNSAAISFDVNWAAFSAGGPACDVWQIRDNTSQNNAGLLVGQFTWRLGYHTDPPGVLPEAPPASRIRVARQNLAALRVALAVYSNDNQDYWPLDLVAFHTDYCFAPRTWWHPGDAQPAPSQIDNQQLDALNSAQISFEYLGAGFSENAPDDFVVFRDNNPANNGGLGRLHVQRDWQVVYVPLCPGDITGEQVVDLADFLVLETHLGEFETADPVDGDLNGDGSTDMHDAAVLQVNFGASCAPA